MRRPFAPTVPFCTAPAHAGLCLGAGGRVEGPGLQVQPVRCEGTTLRQAGRALPSRPVRFLAAPRHPARPPLRWEVAFAARPSCLRAHAPSSCWPPPWPGRRPRRSSGASLRTGVPRAPWVPAPRPPLPWRWQMAPAAGLPPGRASLVWAWDCARGWTGRSPWQSGPVCGRPRETSPRDQSPSAGKAVSRAALSFRDVSRGPA